MEILQTIWNVLITENKTLTDIIVLPLAFLEAYLYTLLFTTILKINGTKKQRTLFVLIYTFTALLCVFFIPYPYYTFVNLLAMPVLIFVIFKTTVLKSILSEIIVYAISILVGTPLILIYTCIFKISSYEVTAVAIHKALYSIILYVLYYALYKLYKHFNFNTKLNIRNKFKNKNYTFLIINLIIGTIAIAFQCYIEFIYIDYLPIYLVFIGLFILTLYFIINIFSLFRTSKLETTTEKLEEEKLLNQTLTLLYDKIRGFKHDFNNIVQGIGGYISTDNMDGLKEYYSQILDDCQRVNNLALLSPEIINNPAIYSLLTAKYHEALDLGIKVNLDVFMDLSNINMKIYELTRILGVLFDNAIEAAKQCEEKEINITFRKQSNKQLFIIENTYTNKDVNIDAIFEKGKTSKKTEDSKNHGIGLWEVRQTLKKSKNLNLYTTKSEKFFKQQFEIYC